ncbi:hypothetical protein FOL46_007345 [Perkinsus olseni]|uniref:BRCT domain-containing protein n=1 Tax=Perkinsus olseni TaxID=32597 RepID=A0A7J6LF61_PEROL|nr:hypothetical protein FOL46_007345 [Perkinsus olseni]
MTEQLDESPPDEGRRPRRDGVTSKGLFFMALLALQFGSQPQLQSQFINRSVNTTMVVLLTEIVKLLFAIAFMLLEGSLVGCLSTWRPLPSLAVAALPAATYALQNQCIQTAYRNLDPLVFNLVNQTKLLWAAVLTYLILGRRQSSMQVLALSMLFVSAVLISIGQQSEGPSEYTERDPALGMFSIIVASALSGIGAAVSELALRSYNRNSYLFSAELAMYSALLVIGVEATANGGVPELHPDFYTGLPLIPILTQALGGIVVGQVTKHAGSVVPEGEEALVSWGLPVILREIIAVDALPKDNEGDLILRTLSVLPAALSTNVMACLPREQRLVLAIDLDMLVVWSFEPATIALMAGSSHKRLQQPSRASGLGQVSVKGLNSEYPVCVRLRRGASEFVHRAAQAYDVGVISTKLSRSMVAAVAGSVDGGGGGIAFVRGNDDIGLGQDYSSIVPRDRGEIIVLSDDKFPALEDLAQELISSTRAGHVPAVLKHIDENDHDGGVLKEVWINCLQRIQNLRVGLWQQYQLSGARAKAEVQRSVLQGCVICLGPKWPKDSRKVVERRLTEFGAAVWHNPLKARWEEVTHIICWRPEVDDEWRKKVNLPADLWAASKISVVHRAWAARVFALWIRPLEETFKMDRVKSVLGGEGKKAAALDWTEASHWTIMNTIGWNNAKGTKLDMWIEDVKGEIPEDIRGTFIRNGPGLLNVYGEELKHPIDGDGLVVALAFNNGRAHLRSRFVSTFSHRAEEAAGRMLYPGQMGSEPKLPAVPRRWRDPSHTNVLCWGGRVLSFHEYALPHRLCPRTLETVRQKEDLGKSQTLRRTSAHFRVDGHSRRLVTVSFESKSSQVQFNEYDQHWKHQKQITHQIPGLTYVHDFVLTPDFYIVHMTPFVSLDDFKHTKQAPGLLMKYHPELPSRLVVIPRSGDGPVRQCGIMPFHIFHFAHCDQKERNGKVAIELSALCLPEEFTMEFKDKFFLSNSNDAPGQMFHFSLTFSPGKDSVTAECVGTRRLGGPACGEFPTVHPLSHVVPASNRFIYLMGNTSKRVPFTSVIKIDRQAPETPVSMWKSPPGCTVGEPVFCPRVDRKGKVPRTAAEEEDGYIVVQVYDSGRHSTYFALLDARDISIGPICEASQAVALQFDFLSTEEQDLDELSAGMEQSLRKQILRAWFKEWTVQGVYQGICDFYREHLGCEFDEVLPEYLASSHLSQLVRQNVTGYKLWALTVQHGGNNSGEGALELGSKILSHYLLANNVVNRTSVPVKLLLLLSNRMLKKDQKLALCLFHVDVADRSPRSSNKAGHSEGTKDFLPQLMACAVDTGTNLVLECDDNITQISLIDPESHSVVELADFTMESVRHVFVPNLLSDRPTATAEGRAGDYQRDDAGHFDALWRLFGGHPATLRKLSEYFDEATKMDKAERTKKEMEMREHRKRGKMRDIVSPCVFEGTIRKNDALRNCATVLMSTDPSAPLRADLAIFDEQIAELMNSRPLQNIRRGLADLSSGSMCPVEYKVIVLESVRHIVKRCTRDGGIVVPAGLTLADIRHPVVVGMLHANLLSCKWKPVPRVQVASVLTRRLLLDWADSEFDAMTPIDKAKY